MPPAYPAHRLTADPGAGSITLVVINTDKRIGRYRTQCNHLQDYSDSNQLPLVSDWLANHPAAQGICSSVHSWAMVFKARLCAVTIAEAAAGACRRRCARACGRTCGCTSTTRRRETSRWAAAGTLGPPG